MKSLYIVNEISSAAMYGVGTYIDVLIKEMSREDLYLNVICLYSEQVTVPLIEIHDGVRYFKIGSFRPDSSNVLKDKERYYRNIYCFLYPYLTEEKNEMIFHFNFIRGYELAVLLKKNFSCKIILTVHYISCYLRLFNEKERLSKILANEPDSSDLWMCEEIEKEKLFITDCIDCVIVPSKHSAQKMKAIYGVDDLKMEQVSHGLADRYIELTEEEKKQIKHQFHFADQEKLIIYSGRLDALKRVDFLIEAFKCVLQRDDNARLVIAGDGNFRKYMEQTASFWPKISFTGFVSKDILYKLYSISELGVIPSYYEEFGYVAIEMMMMGLPVIANKTTGLAEIIEDGVDGVSYTFGDDICELSQKIGIVLEDSLLRGFLKKNERKKYLGRYEVSLFRRKMLDIYHKI